MPAGLSAADMLADQDFIGWCVLTGRLSGNPLIFMDGAQTPAEAARRWWSEPDHYAALRAAWIDHGMQGWPVPDPAMVARARAELIARSAEKYAAYLRNYDLDDI